MNEHTRDIAADSAEPGQPSRVRFKGIVESDRFSEEFGVTAFQRDGQRWNARSRQVWLVSWLVAVFTFFSFMVGPPLGNFLAYRQIYGTSEGWNMFAAYGTETILFAFVLPVLILLIGYVYSRMATMMNAAESIAAAASQMVTPDVTAAHNADAVGEVVQGHILALNDGLDGALTRLAGVEALIRQHVEAIEIAGEAIEQKATGAVVRVADERTRLMELTENLNTHADDFAAAIAERAQSSLTALETTEKTTQLAEHDFNNRLGQLEAAAGRAVASFESLRAALQESTANFANSVSTIDDAARHTEQATKRASAAADQAAQVAAVNAANVASSAERAAERSKEAADQAIEAAMRDAERVADSAISAASEQAGRVQEAATDAVVKMTEKTNEAVEAASVDAEKAAKAAADVSDAASRAAQAAQRASQDVAAASEAARAHSEKALSYTDQAASQIAERNRALSDARAALEKENRRLDGLIAEQRQRADRLAEAIASQTERLSKLADAQLADQEEELALRESDARKQEAAKRASEMAAQAEREAEEARAKAAAERDAAEQAARAMREKAAAEEAREAQAKRQAAEKQAQQSLPIDPPSEGPAPTQPSPPNGAIAARLDELARDIAERRPRRKKAAAPAVQPASAKTRRDMSWREILDSAADSEPLDLGPPATRKAPAANANGAAPDAAANDAKKTGRDPADDAIRIIANLQAFTYDLETRLYGDPPPALAERFERGDRNVFANRLLRLNEADVKRRIRNESARDRGFESNVQDFLQSFEKLLEDATTSETADEELEEYLSSPLGRVYLLIGATVGYFA